MRAALLRGNGFPFMVWPSKGTVETKAVLPVVGKFMSARCLAGVAIVADAGMICDANMDAIEAGGLRSSSA